MYFTYKCVDFSSSLSVGVQDIENIPFLLAGYVVSLHPLSQRAPYFHDEIPRYHMHIEYLVTSANSDRPPVLKVMYEYAWYVYLIIMTSNSY